MKDINLILEEIENLLKTENTEIKKENIQPTNTEINSEENKKNKENQLEKAEINSEENIKNEENQPKTKEEDEKKTTLLVKYQNNCLKSTNFEPLLQKIQLIRYIMEQILYVFGDIYEYSEGYFFNVVNQALEVVVFNGYSSDKFENMTELFLYQLFLTSFREDHQILFSFYYSLHFLKEIGQNNKLLWNYFIQGPVHSNEDSTWFQSKRIQENWESLKQVLHHCFKITDSNLPALFIENKDFVNIKIKREKEDVISPKNAAKKIISEKNFQTSQNFGENQNNLFFPTETNITENEKLLAKKQKITTFDKPKEKQGLTPENNEHTTILTRRKNRKSQTMNLTIQPNQKKIKKFEKRNELCIKFA